jgi:hypothetical protein
MKRMFIAVVSMLSVYGLSGALVITVPATADTTMHTRRLVLHSMTETSINGANTFGGTDVAKARGQIVGYDAISGRFYPKQTKVILHLAFALKGGILVCRLAHKGAGPDDVTLVGTITKGSGRYDGVTGTITWREVKRNKVLVTLRYHC